MDALTTMAFLHLGVHEGNPLVRWMLAGFARPETGVLIAKLAGVALGVFAWRSGRLRLLRRMNLLFGLCVLWNLAAIAVTVSA